MDLGKRIKSLRKSKGLTLEKVHERTGISRATLSSWENNKTYPSMTSLERWANGIGIEVWDIFFGEADFQPTAEEIKLVTLFRELNRNEQEHLLSLLKTMARRSKFNDSNHQ